MRKSKFLLLPLVAIVMASVSCVYRPVTDLSDIMKKTELKPFDSLENPLVTYRSLGVDFVEPNGSQERINIGGFVYVFDGNTGKLFDYCYLEGQKSEYNPVWKTGFRAEDGSLNYVFGSYSKKAVVINSKNPNQRKTINLRDSCVAYSSGYVQNNAVISRQAAVDEGFSYEYSLLDFDSNTTRSLGSFKTSDQSVDYTPVLGADGKLYYFDTVVDFGERTEVGHLYQVDIKTGNKTCLGSVDCMENGTSTRYKIWYADSNSVILASSLDQSVLKFDMETKNWQKFETLADISLLGCDVINGDLMFFIQNNQRGDIILFQRCNETSGKLETEHTLQIPYSGNRHTAVVGNNIAIHGSSRDGLCFAEIKYEDMDNVSVLIPHKVFYDYETDEWIGE